MSSRLTAAIAVAVGLAATPIAVLVAATDSGLLAAPTSGLASASRTSDRQPSPVMDLTTASRPDGSALVADPAGSADDFRCPPSGGPACAITLTDIALHSPGEGWVVGDRGFIARFRNGRLSPVDSPTDEIIQAVAATSADAAWAVGRGIFRYESGAWTVAVPGDEERLLDVDFADPEAGWAVGWTGSALHYRAGMWESQDLPTERVLVAVDAVSADEAWGVDSDGAVLRFADGMWSVDADLPCQPHCRPNAIIMSEGGEGWVSGLIDYRGTMGIPYSSHRAPMLYRRGADGVEDGWHPVDVPALAQESAITALAISGGEGWAAVDNGGLLRLLDGEWSWHHAPAAPPASAIALDGVRAWAVGHLGSILLRDYGCWSHAGGPALIATPNESPPGNFRALAWRAFLPHATSQGGGSPHPYHPHMERLTYSQVDEWQPALAPHGMTLAYVERPSDEFSTLMTRDECGNAHAVSLPGEYHNKVREEVPSFTGAALDINIVHSFTTRLERDFSSLARIRPDGSGRSAIALPREEAGSQPRRPGASPDGVWIAYDAEDDPLPDGTVPGRDIFVLDVFSGEVRRLTDHPAEDRLPVFDPNSRTIFFRSERDGNSEIYSIDVYGEGLTRITNNSAFDTWPNPSPDGRFIVFQTVREGREGLAWLDMSTGDERFMSTAGHRALTPHFTQDGRSVLFASDVFGQLDIFRMPLPW